MLGPEKDDGAPEGNITALVWQSGQIVAGRETLLTELLRRNGFVSHADENGLGQGEYVSLERVLADPPDLLLIAGDSLGQEHPTLGNLTETRVERLDPSLLYCAGPTMPKLNDRLAAIHRSMMQERGL
jgi:iron complex transport system substrate-binding protein